MSAGQSKLPHDKRRSGLAVGLAGVLRLEEHLGQVLKQLPRRVGVGLDELPKVPAGHQQAVQSRGRGYGGSTDLLGDQRQLAEVVARTELLDLLPVDGYRRGPLSDDEKVAAAHLPFGDHAGSRFERTFPERVAEFLELSLAEIAEKPDAL